MRYAVVYGTVLDTSDGVLFDILFLAGCTDTEDQAEELKADVTNDKSIPGSVIPRVFPFYETPGEIQKLAHKWGCQTATEMYDVEEMAERRDRARKRK